MNVFMPCATIEESVRALDDKRLIKQILECKQILEVFDRLDNGEQKVGYANHPVVRHYYNLGFDGKFFVVFYAIIACREYTDRFFHRHSCWFDFDRKLRKYAQQVDIYSAEIEGIYVEGSKGSQNCIRETDGEKVLKLFKQKLIKKWDNDKYPPKWTNREPPSWYSKKA